MLHFPRPRLFNQGTPIRHRVTVVALALVWIAACGPEQSILRTVTTTDPLPGVPRPDAAATDVNNPPTNAAAEGRFDGGFGGDFDAALPDAPGATDGTVATPPAADAAVATDVLSVTPPLPPLIDAASTATDVPVPVTDAAPDAPAERLTVESDQPENDTDLTDVGQLDWVHWGLGNANEPNRKRNAARQIRWSVIGDRGLGTYDDRPVGFSWRDGVPTPNARTRQGITVGSEVGVGYRLRFDGPMREGGRLLIYVGAWNARGELRVRLRNTDVAMQTRNLDARAPGRDRVFTIDFGRLNDDESVIVEWLTAELHNPAGNVTLQAAAIAPHTVGALESGQPGF
jgi:hypothetical protein